MFVSVRHFSSSGWFSFSSTIISCHQQLAAFNSRWLLIWKKISIIFMYMLELIHVLNFSSLGWFSFSSAFTAVISCWQLMRTVMKKKSKLIFLLPPKCNICAKFDLCMLLGDPARECDARHPTPDAQQMLNSRWI